MQYAITQGGKEIGVAQMQQQGLYYRVQCQCRIEKSGFHRVMLSNGTKCLDLGICIPVNEVFVLEKRIQRKEIGEGPVSFFVPEEQETAGGRFVAVHPQQPFAYLAQLNNAIYAKQDGEIGLLLDGSESSRPTGQ